MRLYAFIFTLYKKMLKFTIFPKIPTCLSGFDAYQQTNTCLGTNKISAQSILEQ